MSDFPQLKGLLKEPLYDHGRGPRRALQVEAMREVTRFHIEHCTPYARLCAARGFDVDAFTELEDIPYLPTRFFKQRLLLSIPTERLFREVNSSATTSGTSSRMGLDRPTSRRQSKCFTKTVTERCGNTRRRFVVLDAPDTLERGAQVSARSSTIKSLLFLASSAEAVLDGRDGALVLDEDKLERTLREASQSGEPVIVFGFTYVLYAHVVRKLMAKGIRYPLPPDSIVVHIGGWKKLEAEKVTHDKLIADCADTFGVPASSVIDIYGFTEQAGLIYPTCEAGRRHAMIWSEVVVRDPDTLAPLPHGETGLLQFLTPIQTSYPGHSVLTEDMGVITGEDDCPCGRKGRTFTLKGRAPNSEVRGCGDIMAEKFA